MLVLSVKRHEAIIVGLPDGFRLTISIAKIKGNDIKIGIESNESHDASTAIYRQTILDGMSAEEQDRILRAGRAKS